MTARIVFAARANRIGCSFALAVTLLGNVVHGQTAPSEPLGLESVPANTSLVVSIKPAEIAARGDSQKLSELIELQVPGLKAAKLGSKDLRELLITFSRMPHEPTKVRRVYRFADAGSAQKFVEALEHEHIGGAPGAGQVGVQVVNGMTIIVGEAAARNFREPRWAKAWRERKDSPIAVVLDMHVAAEIHAPPVDGLDPALLTTFAPLFHDVDFATLGVDFSDKLQVTGSVECSKKSAERVRDLLQALSTTVQNALREQIRRPPANKTSNADANSLEHAHTMILGACGQLLTSAQIKCDGDLVNIAMTSPLSLKEIGELAAAAGPIAQP
jgi:hypothetical protein